MSAAEDKEESKAMESLLHTVEQILEGPEFAKDEFRDLELLANNIREYRATGVYKPIFKLKTDG